jgi:hypothetical protein
MTGGLRLPPVSGVSNQMVAFAAEFTDRCGQALSPASRALLGVPGTATTEQAYLAAYRRVRYCFAAIGHQRHRQTPAQY